MIKNKRPSKHSIIQFIWFNLGGVAFFVLGYLMFVLLYGLLSWHWLIAKAIADLTGWSANYLIQRFLAFRHESKHHSERSLLKRFSIVSVANVPLDYAIVGGLKWLGVTPFLGLWISSLFFTVWKFAWYKWWVFKVPGHAKDS